jgi:hypothetical protein
MINLHLKSKINLGWGSIGVRGQRQVPRVKVFQSSPWQV